MCLGSVSSSGDSAGLSAADSRQRYTDVANARPSTVLALNHEVQGKLPLYHHVISTVINRHFQLPLCEFQSEWSGYIFWCV